MAVDVFVLPYRGRSAGAIFWRPDRSRARRREPPTGGDVLSVYAPGPLSPGEVAEVHAHVVAALGRELRAAERPALLGGWLFWWWAGGVLAAAALAIRALTFGPGHAWIEVAAAASALPLGAGAAAPPWRSRRLKVLRQQAASAMHFVPQTGAHARTTERLAALWRVAPRLSATPERQLAELEAHCREQAWPEAAAFYALARSESGPAEARGALERLLRRLGRASSARRPRAAPLAVLEMRAW